jgi:hypothetical protein
MGFDDEIDAARERLKAAMQEDETESFDDLAALNTLLPELKKKIQSRRLAFQLGADEDEAAIEVVHLPSDDVLGFVYAEDGEYVFESNLEDYFDDFVDDDALSFVSRLYETLRADLPKYEVEQAGG